MKLLIIAPDYQQALNTVFTITQGAKISVVKVDVSIIWGNFRIYRVTLT
jgi:hypothetical protein